MKIERIGKHKIELYDSIDELPTERFFTYNRMLLIDSGIGGDMDAIDGHISKIMHYLEIDAKEKAHQELINMRSSFYFVTENLNPKHLSYIALVHSIDGRIMTDFGDDNLRRVLKDFSDWGETRGRISKALEVVKKNWKRNWKHISLKHSRVPRQKKLTAK